MLTKTEVQHLKDVIADLMAVANPGEYNEEEAHQAIELLAKLDPMETEEILAAAEMTAEASQVDIQMTIVDPDKLVSDFKAVLASITINEMGLIATLQAALSERREELDSENDQGSHSED